MKSLLIATIITVVLAISAIVACSIAFGYKIRSTEYQHNITKQQNYSDTSSIYFKHDYSFEIESNDTIAVYDKDRLVGKILFTDDSEIGQLILKDNN